MALTVTLSDIAIQSIENRVVYTFDEIDWAGETSFALGDYVKPIPVDNGDGTQSNVYPDRLFEVTKQGTSGATEPSWSDVIGDIIVDGTVEYTVKEKVYYKGIPFISTQIIRYYDLDDNGKPYGTIQYEEISLTDTDLFSNELGLIEESGTVRGNTSGNRVAKDKVKEHQKDAHDWIKTRIKNKRGF